MPKDQEASQAEFLSEETIRSNRERLLGLREILLADVVMAAEIPAPTGNEKLCTRFLSDRFRESGLNDIATDQAGNIAGVIPGSEGRRNLLVAAHVDKIWPESEDHTVSVEVGRMSGRGIADNSLGVATLAALPLILERLGICLQSNLILLGTTRSFGRGDLGGMRFFLENTERAIAAALCVEGMNIGRLSFSSLGMSRGECLVEWDGQPSRTDLASSGAIRVIERFSDGLQKLAEAHAGEAEILQGSVRAGSDYGVPPRSGRLRFEVRSERPKRVAEVEAEIAELAAELGREFEGVEVVVETIARRNRGDLGASHPLVGAARRAMLALGVEPKVAPSISELAALLGHDIPALTLGITRGGDRHTPTETIELDPIFDGLAQLVAVLQFMDASGSEYGEGEST